MIDHDQFMRYKVRDVFDDVTKYGTKIKTSQYLRYGKYPIFDQGKDYIAGYTNEEEGVFQEVPVILFGDHTGIIKYISKPCFLGADGVKLLKPKDSNLVAKYLFYALSNVNIPDTGYSRHFKWLKEGEIPIPSKKQQNMIAGIFDQLSYIVQQENKILSKFDELVKSRFLEIFGDMQCNPHKWTVKPLSTVCHKICDGEHGSVQRVDEGYLYLNAKNIKKDGSIDWEDTTYISLRDHERIYKRCNPEPGDILLTTTGTVGNVAIVPMIGEFSIDRGITLLKVDKDELNSKYLEKLLNSQYMQQCMKKSVHASAIGHLFLKQVKELSIMLPPLYLQDEFANYVTQVDKSKLAVQKSLDELETLKKSLMQTYFG